MHRLCNVYLEGWKGENRRDELIEKIAKAPSGSTFNHRLDLNELTKELPFNGGLITMTKVMPDLAREAMAFVFTESWKLSN